MHQAGVTDAALGGTTRGATGMGEIHLESLVVLRRIHLTAVPCDELTPYVQMKRLPTIPRGSRGHGGCFALAQKLLPPSSWHYYPKVRVLLERVRSM